MGGGVKENAWEYKVVVDGEVGRAGSDVRRSWVVDGEVG
jgi:hypothetical protein